MEHDLAIAIGKKLKAIALNKGMSQVKVAENTGLSFATVNAYLNGKQPIFSHSLQLICDHLGVKPADLLMEPASTDQKILETATLTAQKTIEMLLDQGRLTHPRKK